MNPPLWAPWRMEYVLSPKNAGPCIFCNVASASSDERDERLVVCVTRHASVMLNRYPFASGHLLVIPHSHVDGLEKLSEEEHEALFALVRESTVRLKNAVRAEGLNVGLNLGVVAGGSIKDHLHVHIVPRWSGDTNFMPVLADTRVMPQAIADTRDYLRRSFTDLEQAR